MRFKRRRKLDMNLDSPYIYERNYDLPEGQPIQPTTVNMRRYLYDDELQAAAEAAGFRGTMAHPVETCTCRTCYEYRGIYYGQDDVAYLPISRGLIESLGGDWSRPCQMKLTIGSDGYVNCEVHELPRPVEHGPQDLPR